MASHMKTTVDISDDLLLEAKRVARDQDVTLRAVLETALRSHLAALPSRAGFKLRDASFKGKGLQPEFAGEGWEAFRRAAYGDRGG
jgi:hypothetical protein